MKRSTSWKPGQSGNLAGAPKKEWTWRALLKNELDRVEVKENGLTAKEVIVKVLVTAAVNGDLKAIKEIGDRIDGKSTQIAIESKTRTIEDVILELNDEE